MPTIAAAVSRLIIFTSLIMWFGQSLTILTGMCCPREMPASKSYRPSWEVCP